MESVENRLKNHEVNKHSSEEWIAKVERLLAERLGRMHARQVINTPIEND